MQGCAAPSIYFNSIYILIFLTSNFKVFQCDFLLQGMLLKESNIKQHYLNIKKLEKKKYNA